MIPPLRIALSGGAMFGIAHIGALELLHEKGYLKCVREYIGTSAGAFLAFCLSIGYTLSELRALITVFNFTQIQNLEPEIMFGFIESYGIDDGTNLDKLLGILLRAKGVPAEITFREFAEKYPERPALRIFATEISKSSLKEFSTRASPETALKFAVRASTSIPMIFTPAQDVSGAMFVDGGIITNFPFHNLSDTEKRETIGVTFDMNKFRVEPVPITNILDYFKQLYKSAYYHQQERVYKDWSHRIIVIQPIGVSPLNFEATSEEKEALMEAGQRAATIFLKESLQKPKRRYSLP
jgi:predicted acylesterase/phospholipase RssA